ncbi:MAG: hypothetical protein KF802_11455 [Bdellovibrionaceae bacterium]|nr:hypothetical protein [Pseudobdellovibrionaceae bacterium]
MEVKTDSIAKHILILLTVMTMGFGEKTNSNSPNYKTLTCQISPDDRILHNVPTEGRSPTIKQANPYSHTAPFQDRNRERQKKVHKEGMQK